MELAYDAPTEPSIMANDEQLLTEDNLMQADLPSFSINDSTLNVPAYDLVEPSIPSTPRPQAVPLEAPRSILKRASLAPAASPPKLKETPRSVTFSASTALPVSPPQPSPQPPEEEEDASLMGPPFYDQTEESEVVLLGGSPLEEASDPVTPRPTASFADYLDSEDEDSRSFQRLSPGIGLQMSRAASVPSLTAAVHRPPMRGTRSDAFFLDRLRAAIPTPDGSIDEVSPTTPAVTATKAAPSPLPLEVVNVDEADEEAGEEEEEPSFMDESLPQAGESTSDIPPEAVASIVKPLPPTPPASSSTPFDSPLPAHSISPLANRHRPRPSHLSTRSNVSISEFGVLGSPDVYEAMEILQTPAKMQFHVDASVYATPGNETLFLSPETSFDLPASPEVQPSPLLMKRVSHSDLKSTPAQADLISTQEQLLSARANERQLLLSLISSLRSDLTARDTELDTVKRERDAAEKAYEDTLDEAEKWEREYGGRRAVRSERTIEEVGEELMKEMERLRKEAERSEELAEERDALLSRLAEFEASKHEVADAHTKEQVEQLQHDLDAAIERATIAEAQLDQVEDLADRASKAEANLEVERSRFADLTTGLARAQKRASEAEGALQQSQKEAKRVEELEATVERLRSEKTSSARENSDAHRAALARLEADLASSEAAKRAAEEATRTEETEATKLRDDNARLQAELASMSTIELENARLREDLASTSSCSTCPSRTKELEEVKRALRKAQAESADQGVTIAKLQKAKAALKEDREGLLIALEAKQQEVSLLKRRSSDAHRLKEGRRSSIVPPSTVRATSKASSRSSVHSSLKRLPPTPSIYEETPIRQQLVDRRAAGSALYAIPRRPGIEEKENQMPMLA